MKKIRVVVVINDFLVGGAQRLTAELLSRIDRDHFEVSLVTLFQFEGRDTMYHLLPQDIVVHRLHFGSFADMGSWMSLANILRREKPDVVLSNLFFSNTVTRVLGWYLRYRSIIVEHNTYVDKTRAQVLLDWVLSHGTYKIVAVSLSVKDFTVKQEGIPIPKFLVIPNGVAVDSIAHAAAHVDTARVRGELGIPPGHKLVITVGRMTAQKNFRLLISGFAEFKRAHPEYSLLILGDGGLRADMQRYVEELDASGSIHLPGGRTEVVPYLAASEFFVSTSTIEGLSMAHLEAFACGLPLLATHTASSDTLIDAGHNGLFIEGDTPEAVCQGLERMVQADLTLFRQAAYDTARRYDIRLAIQQYQDLIEASVSPRAPTPPHL